MPTKKFSSNVAEKRLKRRGQKLEERSNCVESRMEDSGLVQASEQLEMWQKTLHQDGDGI